MHLKRSSAKWRPQYVMQVFLHKVIKASLEVTLDYDVPSYAEEKMNKISIKRTTQLKICSTIFY